MLRALLAVLALALSGAAWAQAPEEKKKEVKKPAAKARAQVRPAWAELTAEQQKVLAPLKADWESLTSERRKKWVGIANRYPKMSVQEQERVQRRMQAWVRLTPEQRRQARETYKRLAKERQDNRDLRQKWAEYQALPPDERMHLAPPPPPSGTKKK